LAIADDFREFLGLTDLELKDVTISGSNAAYTYTPHSDIDLHLVVDLPRADASDVYRELFDAKKYQYNDQHNFKIGGYDVELYVQNANQPPVSQGEYSVLNNDWLQVPKRQQAVVDDMSTRSKYEDLGHRIESAIADGDRQRMESLAKKIREMRTTGLAKTGEFGPENLAFKLLRASGLIDRLREARLAAKDHELSLQERKKKKVRYGYGGYWMPGFSFGDGEGGDGGGGESVQENTESPDINQDIRQVLQPFIDSCVEYLGIEQAPKIILKRDPEWTRRNGTFGQFDPETRSVTLAVSGRHVLDILRTLAHELTHSRQNELADMPVDAGETGSPYEDEANAKAGQIMRHWVDQYPEFFKDAPLEESLKDKLAAAAAAACIAGTPGCATTQSMSTADTLKGIQTVGRTAQTVKQMGSAGAKEELIQQLKNELRRQRGQLPETVTDEDYDPNGKPPGPEFKPTMPAGTVKVDVSDVYDWYKLGQHISDLKGLGQHDFGSGPPSTIMAFGSEEEEHKYIDALKKTGLTTTDIDPVDPNRPKGMPRQKTDPTYNVNEAFDQPYPLLRWEKGDFGDVDAIARLDDGTFLSIMFNKGFSKDSKEEAWSVEFYRNNSQEVTGEGDSQRVFATVLSAIQTFIKKYKPNRMTFSASKEVEPGQNSQSRARLYDSLVQRYARAWGYRAFRADTGNKVIYELSRRQPVVAEGPFVQRIVHPNKINIYVRAGKKPKLVATNVSYNLLDKYIDKVVDKYPQFRPTDFSFQSADEKVIAEATGYIPVNDKEARDPRYSMAITQDIKPGEVQRQAKKMGWRTTAAGTPPTLKTSGRM
jgi:hypothetical protein